MAQDVVLVAEVIREANSAYYRPMSPVKTVEAAIMMLGQNGLRMLLARIAFRPLISMQADGFARQAAPQVWNQSEKCALAASLMAPGLSAGVFEAYLAGLMQNVGLVVAFRLADRVCQDGKVPGSSEFGLAPAGRRPPTVGRASRATGNSRRKSPRPSPTRASRATAHLAQALALGDRIAKLRLLIDAHVVAEDDAS